AQAEDLADQVGVEVDALPAVVDTVEALAPGAAILHDGFPDNAFIHATVTEGDIAAVAAAAPVALRRTFRMNRQATVSLEGRGVLAY
ncbi:molybdopterin-dependent oxidoreductase, partial [Klebsiella pneumoniae]|nr:molybdopterin-dependent oxidoreductase [Klebsiella pneumoniae]